MADDQFPAWDYWMWDEDGKYIFKYDHDMGDHPDCDLLWETNWTLDMYWTRELFWTAEEAAALSFGRSPDKVPWNDDHWGVKEMEGSSEFANWFVAVREKILEAQKRKALPERIPAIVYVHWAAENNIPFPPALAQQVNEFYGALEASEQRAREAENKLWTERSRVSHEAEEKLHSRTENNLLKIILGLAKAKYQYPAPGAAKRMSDAILREYINVSEETILGYLKKAAVLPVKK
jgi:hypothetical protein